MPQGGNHAWIKCLLCHGFGVSDRVKGPTIRARNYCLDIYIYSSNGLSSIGLTNSNIVNSGCFHWGQVFCTTTVLKTLGVAIVPDATNPQELCTIWVNTYKWH